jgi:hypothetical protein
MDDLDEVTYHIDAADRRRWRLGGTTIEGGALHADTLVALRRRVGTPRHYAGTAPQGTLPPICRLAKYDKH